MYKICHLQITNIDFMPRVWREAVSAKESGYTVCVIGYGESTERYGISYFGVEPYNSRLKNFFLVTRRMVREAMDTNAEIIQFHSPIFLLYAKKLKKMGKIVIFDSHENYPVQILGKTYIPAVLRKIVSKSYSAYESRICKQIDAVLYPCTFDGKNIFEGRSKRSVKIENYSKKIASKPSKREYRAIYAGAITEARGALTMAEACIEAKCPLVFCGSVNDKKLEERLLSFGREKVALLGMKTREQLFELYQSSYIGLSLLKPEGQYACCDNMSTKIYEYMQCGLPVVLANFSYAKRQNEKHHFGITVDPNNIDEIANAIKYLLNNPDEAIRMGENGKKAIKKEYNWATQQEKLIDLYTELLK